MNRTRSLPIANMAAWRDVLADPLFRIGAIIGFAPVLAGFIFRTYGYHVSPTWAETLRQLDAPFILIEVAVILWARHRGLNYRAMFERLDRPAQFALVLFLCSFWISSAFISQDPGYSMVRASFWPVHIAFGFAVFHLAGLPTKAGLQRGGAALFAGFVLFVPLMAIHLLTAPDPSQVREGAIIWSSAIPGCLSVRHLGIWAALVLACAVGALYAFDGKPREQAIVCALIFMATAILFWSGTRAGIYGIVGALLIVLTVLRKVPPKRTVAWAGAAAILGILISEIWLPPNSAFGIFQRSGAASGGLESFSSGRTIIWAGMMQAFAGSPAFGVGEGAVFWVTAIGDERHVQPHNSIVQMLSSWGLIASLAAGYLVARLLLLIHRMARRDALCVSLVLMIDCLLIMSLADGVLYFSRFIMWFAGGVALMLAMRVRDTAPAEQPQLAPAL